MVDSSHLSGQQFGRYQLEDLIGQGAMGAVYRAYDTELDRYVAFKMLPRDLITDVNSYARFTQEAKIVAKLEHPNIVPIYDYGQIQGICFIVMRLLIGGSLEKRLGQKQFTPDDNAKVLEHLAAALDYAHSQSVVHRDIKPSNVLFDQHGNAYLADFGLAKIVNMSSALTMTGRILGTPPYMAPELWHDKDATPSTDIYALGVLMYRVVSGSLPFEAASPMALMRKHLYATPTPLYQWVSGISPQVDSVVARALDKNPGQRYPTAMAFAQAFRTALSQPAGSIPLPTARVSPTRVSEDASTEIMTAAQALPSDTRKISLRARGIFLILAAVIGLALLFTAFIVIIDTSNPTATPGSSIVVATQSSPPATATSPVSSLIPSATFVLSSTPSSTAQRTSPDGAVYAPVTPAVTMQPGVLSTQQPQQAIPFNWKQGDILTICLASNEFDGEFDVRAPDGTITTSLDQDYNGTPCVTPYVAPVNGAYWIEIRSITGHGGNYSLNLTIYSACAPGLPIAIVENNTQAMTAIRERSNTFTRLISTAVPEECFAVIGQSVNSLNDIWWQIRASDGRTGWIAGVLVTVIGNLSPTATPTP